MTFFLGILFGAIGSGYLLYAKRVYSATYALTGVALMIFPYFIDGALLTLVIGAAICAAPFILARLES